MNDVQKAITIVKPKAAPKPVNGDILQGGSFLSELIDKEAAKDLRVLSLSFCHENHWKAIEKMGLDIAELRDEVEYECPFRSGTRFYRVYPLSISKMLPDEAGEIHSYFLRKNPDDEYFHRPPGIDDVDRSFMGHGYDQNILPDDGHGCWKYAKIDLSDGRWLIVAYWEWYSK